MIQELNLWLIGGGLVVGLLFGAVAQRSRFCVLAAVSNWVLMRDLRQAHAYLAAVAIAVAGTATLELTGLVPIAETGFRSGRIDWFGTLAGGTLFGFGAVLAGGCAGRLLVRSAEGSLGAVVALVAAGIGGAACAYGVLEPVRVQLHNALSFGPASGDASIATFLGLSHGWVAVLFATACALAIIATFRRGASIGLLLAGVLVGALVVGGWWVSGSLAQDPFEGTVRPVSMAFVGPVAETTQLIVTGEQRGSGFHLALIVGVLGGAVASALVRRQFRWAGMRPGELMRAVIGGGFIGVGAVFAGGCNIGQGLTGMSTLSMSALLAVMGIVSGMRLGLAWLMRTESAQQVPRSRLADMYQKLRNHFAPGPRSLSDPTKVAGCCN
jgi:uncharacterized membrane protein YedE/YeeE